MKPLSLLFGLLSLAVLSNAAPGDGGASHDPEVAASKRINHLQKEYQKYIRDTLKTRKTGCTHKNLLRRKEWGSLSKKDRLSYIGAVYCLYNNNSFITPPSEVPGVRNRYNDFVSGHLQLTPFVHADGLFLPFHRFYVHLYEKALREECGYKGAQPYWDWTLSYRDPRQSAVFDGSPWSMGSNGLYIPGREPTIVQAPGAVVTVQPGTGGGCVYHGPFTPDKFQIHLGPVSLNPQGPDGGKGYNPRCLVRDLSLEAAASMRPTNVTTLLDGCQDLGCLNTQMDAAHGGVHFFGHFQMGGVALDVFASPSDPAFWLHHAQVDRLWTIWQIPPSDNVTLDTMVPFGHVSSPKPVRELVSTINGEFCYIYE